MLLTLLLIEMNLDMDTVNSHAST